jgi:hypothetical protein
MQKEYILSPYVYVLRDAPKESYTHFNDLHHLFLKKFLALKDTNLSLEEKQKLQTLLKEILSLEG